MNKSNILLRLSAIFAGILLFATSIFAQSPQTQTSATLDAAARAEIISALLQKLDSNYVFPDVAKKMEAFIRERAARKEYDQITGTAEFARKLTEDLQSVSRDQHLRVLYDGRPLPKRSGDGFQMTDEEYAQFRRLGESQNFGFERVERLEGNIGYFDVRRFFPADFSGDTIAAIMNFVRHTDALVIDLRKMRGGEPETVALVSSYFFDQPKLLNSLYWRPDDRTQQFWTIPHLAGARFLNKPVYLLTSRDTFSGGEEFAYDLKNLKRVTIVGETTGGGAHPAPVVPLTDYVAAQIPIARPINPITKTDWEGVGVAPDIAVSAAQALKTAHLAAVKDILGKAQDPDVRRRLTNLVERMQKENQTP